ncbi:MAG: hypothetical protein Q4B96_06800 [Bacillota bacterium]|nr:hypothetical protein [Bacillota bacterium]
MLILYGAFLSVCGIFKLLKLGERKTAVLVAGIFIAAPLIVLAVAYMPMEKLDMWVALPAVLLLLAWGTMGYFVDNLLKKERKLQEQGQKRVRYVPTPKARRNAWLMVGGGAALWLFGKFVGFGANGTLETCMLCICVFLLARGMAELIKNMGI